MQMRPLYQAGIIASTAALIETELFDSPYQSAALIGLAIATVNAAYESRHRCCPHSDLHAAQVSAFSLIAPQETHENFLQYMEANPRKVALVAAASIACGFYLGEGLTNGLILAGVTVPLSAWLSNNQ